MVSIKTTISVDEDTLNEFKKIVLSRRAGSRNLSHALEEAMRNYNTTAMLKEYARKKGISLESLPSAMEIMNRRPSTDMSSGEEIREMREDRAIRLSRQ